MSTEQERMCSDSEEHLPATTGAEQALDAGAFVASAIPYIGGPLSNIISGVSRGRRMKRVVEFVENLSTRLRALEEVGDSEYVRSDEFEELLEQTIHHVAAERHEEKRAIYRSFLYDAVAGPRREYDEQLAFMRTLEDIQPAHLRVLQALETRPDESRYALSGSPLGTLLHRLPNMSESEIRSRVQELRDLRVVDLGEVAVMMTGHGAENLAGGISAYGRRLLQYVRDDRS